MSGERKYIFLINEGDLPEEGSVYAEQILYEKLFRWKDYKAVESQLSKVTKERDRAVRLLEKLVHPKLFCETNLYNLVSEAEELLSSLTENKS